MITKTKIDWCDFSFNPAWGCLNKCPYCYARNIAMRFARNIFVKEVDFNLKNKIWIDNLNMLEKIKQFKPTWLESNYQKSFPKKPSKIFVNSMSDPMYWEQSWYEKIVKRIAENQQHTFMILTKHPEIYQKYIFPHNTWLGMTLTWNNDFETFFECYYDNVIYLNNITFVSVEPIKAKIDKKYLDKYFFDWIIVGPETGNRKDKHICTPEMLEPFFSLDIPVFMKGACAKITDKPLRQEFPE